MSSTTPPVPPLPDDLKRRVLDSVRETPARTRQATQRVNVLLAVLAAAGVLITFFVWGDGPHYGFREWGIPRTPLLIILTLSGATAITTAVLWFAVRMRGSMLAPSIRTLLLVSLGAALALFVWKFGVTAAFGQLHHEVDRAGFKCLQLGTVMGLFPLAALLFVRRRSEPNHPVATGLLYGAAAGCVSFVFIELWCPSSFFLHLVRGHWQPIANLALLGSIVGWFVLSLPPYRPTVPAAQKK